MISKILYQITNWRAHLRAIVQGNSHSAGTVTYKGVLSGKVIRPNGATHELGVLSSRVVTTAGVNFLATTFSTGTPVVNLFNYHASGTGAVAEAITDVALGTDSAVARVAGVQSNPTANQYRTVATQTYVSSLAITEHGIFSAVTAGTLWDRSVFAAINVVSGDSIQFTYTLTCTAGG